MAVATSTADPGFYYFGTPDAAAQAATAHYWDYYRLDQGHGIDVDRTTLP